MRKQEAQDRQSDQTWPSHAQDNQVSSGDSQCSQASRQSRLSVVAALMGQSVEAAQYMALGALSRSAARLSARTHALHAVALGRNAGSGTKIVPARKEDS
jgi:hypothetical protein